MKTFLHVVYNGYAEVSRTNDTRLWNTMLVPLKKEKKGQLEYMMQFFDALAKAYIFTAFNCDRNQFYVKEETLK